MTTGAAHAEPVRSSERTYVIAVSLSHALIHATELTFAAVLLRIEEDFGSDLFLLGVLANVGAFAFGFGALPAGVLVDRFGSVRILQLTLGTTAVGAALVAAAPGELWLGVFLAALGLATGLYHPAGVALLARTRQRARNVGLHGAIGNIGIAGAPAMASAVAVAVDWRAAFVLLAGLSVLGFLATLRLDPRGVELEPASARPADPADTDQGAARRRLGLLLLVYVAFVLSGFIYRGSLTFLPAHIEGSAQISFFGWDAAAVAGSLASLALIGGAFGWYLGGVAAHRLQREPLVLVLSLLLTPALVLVSVASGPGLLVVVFFFVLANFAAQPAFVTLVADYSPPGRLGSSYGVSFFLSFGMGSFAAGFAGFFADRWGTEAVFLVLAVIGALSAALAALLWAQTRRAALAPLAGPAR